MNVDFRRDGASSATGFLVDAYASPRSRIRDEGNIRLFFAYGVEEIGSNATRRAFTEEGQFPWEERSGGGDGRDATPPWRRRKGREGKTRGKTRVVFAVGN